MISPHGETHAPPMVGNLVPCGAIELPCIVDGEKRLTLIVSGRALWIREGKAKTFPERTRHCEVFVEGVSDKPILVIGFSHKALALSLWGYAPVVKPVYDENGKKVYANYQVEMCLNPFRISCISTGFRVNNFSYNVPRTFSTIYFSGGHKIEVYGHRIDLQRKYFSPCLNSPTTAAHTRKLIGLLSAADFMDNSNDKHTHTPDESQLADDLGDRLRSSDQDLPSGIQAQEERPDLDRDAT